MALSGHSRQPEIRDFHTRNGYSAHPNRIWEHPALLRYGKPDPAAHLLWTILSEELRYSEAPRGVVVGKGASATAVKLEKGTALISCRGLATQIRRSPGYVNHKLRALELMEAIALTPIKDSDGKTLATLVTDRLGVRNTQDNVAPNLGRRFGAIAKAPLAQPATAQNHENPSRMLDAIVDDLNMGYPEKSIPTHHPMGGERPSPEQTPSKPEPQTKSKPVATAPSRSAAVSKAPKPQPKPQKPKSDKAPRPPAQPVKTSDMPAQGRQLLDAWKALGLHQSARFFQGYFLPLAIAAIVAALAEVGGDVRRLLAAMFLYCAKLERRGPSYKHEFTCSFSNFFINGVWLEYLPPVEPQEAAPLRQWLEERLDPADHPKLFGLSIPKVRDDGALELHATPQFRDFILLSDHSHLLRSLPFHVHWIDRDIANFQYQQWRIQQALDDWQRNGGLYHPS